MAATTARLAATCAAAAALGLVACGRSTTTPSGSATSATAGPTRASEATGAPRSAATKVSANTASEDEIAAALDSAGVPNAKRWAEEVIEYRPYPMNDPKLTKLRNNIAKYNPGQETTDKIVSALRP